MANLVYKEISATEPVDLATAKTHLGESGDHYNSLITSLITVARERAETFMNRSVVDKTLVLMLDREPDNMFVKLPRAPVKAIVSVMYRKIGEQELQTLDPEKYRADVFAEPGYLFFLGKIEGLDVMPNCIHIEYTTGYGNRTVNDTTYPNPLPGQIKQGILMSIRTMYDFRDDLVKGTIVARVPQSAEYLYGPFRIFEFL